MEDFRRQFLAETAEKLENLHHILRDSKDFSVENRRETFRLLHTIKGTAQTFGFSETSRLAHDLETLLAADENRQNLIVEGIEFLQKSLTEEKFQLPEQFTEKLRTIIPTTTAVADLNHLPEIPAEFYSQLSNREKEVINAAIRGGKNQAVLEIGFETANFAAGLINFREALDSEGEIVATFPSAKFNAEGKIGFQFLTTNLENAENLAAENGASVLWENSTETEINDFGAILCQIVRHGREIAAKFDKQITFETKSDELNSSSVELKIVFETLLHLVRNAVDHAIENTGTIKINLKRETDNLLFSVADNGRGIDLEQIKIKAIERNLISKDADLDEHKTLELIFQPEFSTKTETTEISGRGVGLDVVKNSVEKFGGKINVRTEKGKGTTFEIVLPREQNQNFEISD